MLPLEGPMLVEAIGQLRDVSVRQLEDSVAGGTRITVGSETKGQALDCRLPERGPWPVAGIADLSLAQAADQLANGQFVPLGMPGADSQPMRIATMGEFSNRGPYHMDIYYDKANGEPQGPFELIQPATTPVPEFPMLWSHDAEKERSFWVLPDSEGKIKSWPKDQANIDKKAGEIWATATRAHYNRDLQFNAQSIIVTMTERKCIGGRAWPSVILHEEDHEYAFSLWCNSTLGLLLHWWVSNKSQAGRGTTTVTSIPNIPTLNVRALSDEQHAEAKRQFELLSSERFLPFDQIDDDPARHKLDRAILVDVLGLPESVVADGGPIDLIRRKLAAEPQIHGGKRSRVVFTEEGERSEPREDRG